MGQLLTPRRVLIVDDNCDAADMVGALLEASGCAIMVAYGGQQALAMADEFRPDVIFLDINMPGMDGYQAATALRQRASGSTARIVALTAMNDAASRATMAAVGFDGHLAKPASLESLIGATR